MLVILLITSAAINVILIGVLVYKVKVLDHIDKEQRDHKKRMENFKQVL